MKLLPCAIPGCFEIENTPRADARGSFVKTFRATTFLELGLEASFTENFYSVSMQGVLRGMHFQLPPADGAKLVSCLQGEILDVALDLRIGSPSYGKTACFQLTAGRASSVYIPRGVAHGFFTARGPAILVYNVSSEYDPALDSGIRWNSFSMQWPTGNPLLSDRDRGFVGLSEFGSPFQFNPTEAGA